MRRHFPIMVLFTALVGCGRQQEAKVEPQPVAPPLVVQAKKDPIQPPAKSDPTQPQFFTQPRDNDKQDKFEAALTDALKLLADGKQDEALLALQTAQAFQDSEFVRGEIAKLRGRIDQDAAVRKTVAGVEAVLEQGKIEDAAQLAQDALREYGGSDAAPRLMQLRLQAEALQEAQSPQNPKVRAKRFRAEADLSIKEKNLRAAALALEQALQIEDDPQLQTQFDMIRSALEKYDTLRDRAAQLRRDPAQLEEAVAALQEAAQAWDTLQIRQDIDEYTLALEKRRPRVSIADFQIRGDVGIADAGQTIADEILPTLRSKFDVVEREQIVKILDELKLENELQNDPNAQQELGKLARVQFLVVGSVSRAGGIVVHARLVDVRSGLIVQTAKVAAPTAEEVMPLLASLGKQLLMNDDERAAFDQEMQQQAARPMAVAAEAPLPPPPVAVAPAEAPVVPFTPLPPPVGDVRVEAFGRFAAPPAVAPPPPQPGGQAELLIKNRLLQVALQLGDNQYRRGNPQAAQAHYNLALNLAPGNLDLRLRLANAQVGPPVVPAFAARPRIAVLNFPTFGNPQLVSPYLSTWTPQHLAPYMLSRYDLADPGEVYWYMARMGLSLNDLMVDPYARRWLGRALNVRYFLLGNINQTSPVTFDVNTYLIDAEYGFLQGQGTVNVHDRFELKLRLGELALLTLMDPIQRANYLADQRFNNLFRQGQQHFHRAAYTDAIGAFEGALSLRPGNTQVLFFLTQARNRHQTILWEQARQQQLLAQQAHAQAAARRQWELAQAADAARLRANQGGVVLAVNLKQQAQGRLVDQARLALKVGNFGLSISSFQSAIDLAPNDELYRDLALARAQAARQNELAAAKAVAQRETALRLKREQELAAARKQIDLDRERHANQAKAQQERDRLAYQIAFDEGLALLNQKQYDAAIVTLQSARRAQRTPAVEALLSRAMVEQAKASAQAKGEKERLELERQLAAERDARLKAEADAKLYQAALGVAQKALAEKNYALAESKFEEAGKVNKTDVVLTGLRQARELQRKSLDDQQKTVRVQKLLAAGQTALADRKYDVAAQAFTQAKQLDPANLEALTGLTKAQDFREKALVAARRENEEKDRQQNFQRLLRTGQDNLKNKQYDAAVIALSEAVKLNPRDETAKSALQLAEKARTQDATAQEEFKKKALVYQKHLAEGKNALAGKRYDDAIAAFSSAQKVLPGDKTSADFLQEAQKARKDQADAIDAKLAAAQKKKVDQHQALLASAQKDLQAGRYDDALKAIAQANVLIPDTKLAQDLSKQVQKARVDAQAAEEKSLALKAQQAVEARVKKLLTEVYADIKAKEFVDATKSLAEARKLAPTDPAVLAAQRDLETARQAAEGNQKKVAAYQAALGEGQKALNARKYDEAVKAFTEASALFPEDAKSRALLKRAQEDWNDAKADAANAAKRQAAYQNALNDGLRAFNAKQYPESIKSANEALKLMPGDARATTLLQQSQQALALLKKTPDDDPKKKEIKKVPNPKAQYQQELQEAETLEKQGKYADAIKGYQEALKLAPKDARATQGLRSAQLGFHITEGQKDLAAGRNKEAIRHFEAALDIAPNNPTAQKLLAKAKKK